MKTPNRKNKIVLNKKNSLKELLEDIMKYGFNWHCNCESCKKIRERINKELT